jgi:coenzyme F420-reducing hydrogenase alpha subunit
MPANRTIRVDYLTRVEGEGALTLQFDGEKPLRATLDIFEPPRFFEAFLVGRHQSEPPDITARICGICPVAYQMSSCRAIESISGVEVTPQIMAARRLLYAGEWIESHALHAFMLHAPDFLGYPDAIAMAKDHPGPVKAALRIKKTGNALVTIIGGREIHPVNVRIGGFYSAPRADKLRALLPDLELSLTETEDALVWAAGLGYPEFERDYTFVSLRPETGYPVIEGRIVSSKGLDIAVEEYPEHFHELQQEHSTALHARMKDGSPYLTGPLARFNLNYDRLSPRALAAAQKIDLRPPCHNPFKMLPIRLIETIYAIEEAISLIRTYEEPDPAWVSVPDQPGTGHGATEAPRGLLYHRYRVGEGGLIEEARIVPPTSQNQGSIEGDLLEFAPRIASLADEPAALLAERVVRNHDPCISCATHFLKLRIEGRDRVSDS